MATKNLIKYIGIILLMLCLIGIGYYFGKGDTEVIVSPPVEITKDSIIRETIVEENEVIKWKIKEIEKNYDQEVSIILSNNDSANLRFFSDYITNYNNERTTTNN